METSIEPAQSKSSNPIETDDISESSSLTSNSASTTRSSSRRKSSLKRTNSQISESTLKTSNSKLRSLNNVKFEAINGSGDSNQLNGHVEDENRPVKRTSSRRQGTPKPVAACNGKKLLNVTATLENQDQSPSINPADAKINRRLSLKSPARKRQKPAQFCPNDENTLDGFGLNNTITPNGISVKPSLPILVPTPSSTDINIVNVVNDVINDDSSRLTSSSEMIISPPTDNDDSQSQSRAIVVEENVKVVVSTKKPRKKMIKRKSNLGLYDQIDGCVTNVSQLYIYKWPLKEDGAVEEVVSDTYVLQEQISELIGVKSFKRKYPDLFRRLIDIKERVYLKENRVVTETQCDLGLTALRLNDVLDIMVDQYPERYTELSNHMAKKRHIDLANSVISAQQQEEASTKEKEPVKTGRFGRALLSDADRMKEMIKKAMKSTTSYNQNLQKERKTERSCYFDLQTMRIQKVRPTNPAAQHKSGYPNGPYPVALLAGQYQHTYKKYTSDELNHLPLNTCLYTAQTPLPLLYDTWKMKQHNPTKHHRTFKKCDSSDEDEPKLTKFEPPQTPELATTETKSNHCQLNTPQSSKSTSLTINAQLLSAHLAAQQQPTITTQNNSNTIRMTVSAAPTVANLISQKQNTTPTIARQTPVFKSCYVCSNSSQINVANANATNTDKLMIHCRSCDRYSHPTCLELNPDLVKWQSILDYHWQCMDCKKCSACQDPHDEEKMMFCDKCDRGFHTYCAGLEEVPSGSFFCKNCEKPETTTQTPKTESQSKSKVKTVLSTPVRTLDKVRAQAKERSSGGKRGRPLGSLNKPKDPNSPKKASSKKLKKLDHSLNYSTYGDLSQSMIDTNSNTMPFNAHNEVSMDDSRSYMTMHDDRSQSMSYDNFKSIINMNLNTDSLIQPMF